MSTEIPSQFTHSVKLEETAKGVRISVHVYGNDSTGTIDDAILTYQNTVKQLDTEKIIRAPMEISEKK